MTELSYVRRGYGPPLVLIHGIGSHWRVWSPILGEVSRHRDVIALDLPGFGDSPPWPDLPPGGGPPGSVTHLADLVTAFLDRLGVRTPEVAGSSLGGGIALELGRRGLARTVTAFAPVGFWNRSGRRWCQAVVGAARTGAVRLGPALPQIMASRAGRAAFCSVFYAHPGRLHAADCLAAARALAGAPGFAEARRAFAHLRPWTYARTGDLTRIPVTIAWGTRDAVLPHRSQARRARVVLPTARHVRLPGCGHLPFADDPSRCAELLLAGTSGHPGPDHPQ
ncbi:alpha/beta fold hydrolase [Actinoplanes aureus]|uniref:Alpha/beta hydrolase n=1 Tax=Actinoplanes aureus TaxID=2792083 RepID=A0A931C892_9ACTN|nr:alpha/beta hydrolase [Actinoplanes aureus]MBG0562761.1 alpha/beta hydrolase [Actinoplanes aureus]